MKDTNTQQVANYHDQLVGRMKTRFPDRNYDSQDGQNVPNDLEQSVLESLAADEEAINGYKDREKVYTENTNKISALFKNSPRAAVFLNTLAVDHDPSAAIYKAYGKEAYDAFRDGDASEVIAKIEAEDAEARAASEQFEAEKAENLRASFDALDKWGDEHGLDPDQKVETFMRFYDILSDALIGKYSPELFEMGWKADHYNNDVETARHEGEVTGRNANIKEKAIRRDETQAMPPALSGQGVRANESQPVEEDDDPWMLNSR